MEKDRLKLPAAATFSGGAVLGWWWQLIFTVAHLQERIWLQSITKCAYVLCSLDPQLYRPTAFKGWCYHFFYPTTCLSAATVFVLITAPP